MVQMNHSVLPGRNRDTDVENKVWTPTGERKSMMNLGDWY